MFEPSDDTGSLFGSIGHAFSSAAKSIGHVAGQGLRVVDKIPGTQLLTSQIKLVGDLGSGKNALKSFARVGSAAIATAEDAAKYSKFVPGLGAVGTTGLQAAALLGKKAALSDAGLSAARAVFAGNAQAAVIFDTVTGLVKRNASGAELAALRGAIGGNATLSAAFDAAAHITQGGTPVQATRVLAAQPNKTAQQQFAKAVVVAHQAHAALANPRARVRRPRVVAGHLSPRAKSWIAGKISGSIASKFKQVGALSSDGAIYTVEKNDSAWRIANNLTGDGNGHWHELVAANCPPHHKGADGNFTYLAEKEVLKIPSTWKLLPQFKIKPPAAAVQPRPPGPPPVVLPGVPQPSGPVILPGVTISVPVPSPSSPVITGGPTDMADPVAIAQGKAILVTWEHTDGVAAAGLADYGINPLDQTATWTPRDGLELMAFEAWSNAHGSSLPVSSDFTQAALQALIAWSESKAAAAAPGGAAVPPPNGQIPAPAATNVKATPAGSSSDSSGVGPLLFILGLGGLVIVGVTHKTRRAKAA